MKVLGINTSPRGTSNVRIALEAALDGASSKGAETEIVDVNKLTITHVKVTTTVRSMIQNVH